MDTDVLVVWAGPIGLMLANQLVRRDIRTLMGDPLRELGCSLSLSVPVGSVVCSARCLWQ